AGPVLGSPLPTAGRGSLRGAGGVSCAAGGSEFRPPRPGNAAIDRLDRRSPLPVRRSAIPPVWLAGGSRSRPALCRAPPRCASPPEYPQTLFAGARRFPRLYVSASGDLLHGGQTQKSPPFSFRTDCPPGVGIAPPRRPPPPRPGDRGSPLRDSAFRTHLG